MLDDMNYTKMSVATAMTHSLPGAIKLHEDHAWDIFYHSFIQHAVCGLNPDPDLSD